MARAPRSKVSKTSGQGVSRLSYQRGYSMAGGSGEVPNAGSRSSFDPPKGTRNYAKNAKGGQPDINVEYGEHQVATRTLDDVEKYAGDKPTKGLNLTRKIGKDIK